MFPRRYFPGRYFAPRYFPQSQGTVISLGGTACGTLYITPRFTGTLSITPRVTGTLAIDTC